MKIVRNSALKFSFNRASIRRERHFSYLDTTETLFIINSAGLASPRNRHTR